MIPVTIVPSTLSATPDVASVPQVVQAAERHLRRDGGAPAGADDALVRAQTHTHLHRRHESGEHFGKIHRGHQRRADAIGVCQGESGEPGKPPSEPEVYLRAQTWRHLRPLGQYTARILYRADGRHVNVAYIRRRPRGLAAGRRPGVLRNRPGTIAEFREPIGVERRLEDRGELLAALAVQEHLERAGRIFDLLGCGIRGAQHDGTLIRGEPSVLVDEVFSRLLLAGDDLGQLLEERQHVLLRAHTPT